MQPGKSKFTIIVDSKRLKDLDKLCERDGMTRAEFFEAAIRQRKEELGIKVEEEKRKASILLVSSE